MKICSIGFDLPEGKVKYQDERVITLDQKLSPKKITPFYVEFTNDDFSHCDGFLVARDRLWDLLILDMIMEPEMDGLETYRRILEIHPRQKAIVVSGYSETGRVREAQQIGAGIYIKKPFLFEAFAVAVKSELNR